MLSFIENTKISNIIFKLLLYLCTKSYERLLKTNHLTYCLITIYAQDFLQCFCLTTLIFTQKRLSSAKEKMTNWKSKNLISFIIHASYALANKWDKPSSHKTKSARGIEFPSFKPFWGIISPWSWSLIKNKYENDEIHNIASSTHFT